jgi:enamine deaminase RidA (YjgF/YER057c/UK114 family)
VIQDRLRELGLRLPAPVQAPPGVRLPFAFIRVHGDLDRVTGWVKALGFVNCAEGFTATPGPINGFSDLILELWGDAGVHARSAIGAGELPFGMPVEVEAVVALA